ncbi:MAG: FHA domain-containing protein [Verrucomicrobiota bacterium]
MERLVAASGHGFELAFGENVIGVGPGVQVPVRGDLGLDARHYCIRKTSEGCELTDFQSSSGTWINGSKVSGICTLKSGDVIQAGSLSLRYEASVAVEPETEKVATEEPKIPTASSPESGATLQFGQYSEKSTTPNRPSTKKPGVKIGTISGLVAVALIAIAAVVLWSVKPSLGRFENWFVSTDAGNEMVELAPEKKTEKEIFLTDLEKWVPTRGAIYHYRDVSGMSATMDKLSTWAPEQLAANYGVTDLKGLVPERIGPASIRHSLIFSRSISGSILGSFEENIEFMRVDRPLDDAAWEKGMEEFVSDAAGLDLDIDWSEWNGTLYGELTFLTDLGMAPYAIRVLDENTVAAGPAQEVKALTPLNRKNPVFETFLEGDEAIIVCFDFDKFPDVGLMGVGIRSDFENGCIAFDLSRKFSVRLEVKTASEASGLKLAFVRDAIEQVRSLVEVDNTPLGKSLAKLMGGVKFEMEEGMVRFSLNSSFEEVTNSVMRMEELANRHEEPSLERLAMNVASVGNAAIAAGSAELKEAHDLETAIFLVEKGVNGGAGSEFEEALFRVPAMSDDQITGIKDFLRWESGLDGFVMVKNTGSSGDSFFEQESALMAELVAAVAPEFVHKLANENAGRRNAQNIASVSAAANAAGTDAFNDVRQLEEAVRLISSGVYGEGDFSETRFAVPNLDEASIYQAMEYLEWEDEIKVIVYTGNARKEEGFVPSVENEETIARRNAQNVAAIYAAAVAAGAIPSPPEATLENVVDRVVIRPGREGRAMEGAGEFRGTKFFVPGLSDEEVERLMHYLIWEEGILRYESNPKQEFVGA